MPRKDEDKWMRQIAANQRARRRALSRLREQYRDAYDVLYAEEAAKEGVQPRGARSK